MSDITHKAIFTEQKRNRKKVESKVFDYNDGLKFTDRQLNRAYIINVPCYKVTDITLAIVGYRREWVPENCTTKNPIRIETDNHMGRKHKYVLATPEMTEYITQEITWRRLKGKSLDCNFPKIHKKVVFVYDLYVHYKYFEAELKIQDKRFSDYLIELTQT